MPTVDPLAAWRLLIKDMGGGGNATPKALTTPYGVASTDILTSTAHGLVAGDRVQFTSLTGGAGLSTNVTYRVSSTSLTADNFRVASMDNGALINFTTDVTAGAFRVVGQANNTTITVNATTNVYRQNATTGIIDPYPHNETIGAGGPYAVETVIVPYDPVHGTGGSTYKFLEGPKTGGLVSYWTNSLGYGNITVNDAGPAFDRGPGATALIIDTPAAHACGASLNYNAAGEMHFTLLVDDPNVDLLRPKRQHYAIEFWDGAAWVEQFAGMLWDFEATETEIVYYGIDYLGLLSTVWDERFDPAAPKKPYPTGSFYTATPPLTISQVVTAHLNWATGLTNSNVGFIDVGTIATMSEEVSIYSTMSNAFDFVVGLLDSHRAGTGKFTRLSVKKIAGVYTFVVEDDPGSHKDSLALQYIAGGLVSGYKAIPFGPDWASRVNYIGKARDGGNLVYVADDSAVDQGTWGRIGQAPVFIESHDKADVQRRARQAAVDASKLGKSVSAGLKLGSFRPGDGYDICDQIPVGINHGAVNTGQWGSDDFAQDPSGDPSAVEALYWTIINITWESFDDGHWETTLGLWPTGGGAPLTAAGSNQALWQFLYYNTNLNGGSVGHPCAVLNTAPAEGNLLVAWIFSRETDLTIEDDAWTLQAGGQSESWGYFGTPYIAKCYTRVAGAGEDIYIMRIGGVGSGLGDGVYVYAMEVPNGVPSQPSTAIGRIYGSTHNAKSITAYTPGTFYYCIAWGRQDYFAGQYWTPDSGTTEILDTNVMPAVWLGSKAVGTGTVTVGATAPAFFEGDGSRPTVEMTLFVSNPDYLGSSAPVTPQVPVSAGNGPPSPLNTTSETYIDLSTGQQYVRDDATDTWVAVAGTMPLRSEVGVLAFNDFDDSGLGDGFAPPGPPGPPGIAGPMGPPGMDGDGEDLGSWQMIGVNAPEPQPPSDTQTLAAGTTVLANARVIQIDSSGNVTLTSAPTIADGYNGQMLTILNVDSADTITFQDQGTLASSNLRLTATTVGLAPRQSMQLMYSATVGDWVQVGSLVTVI